MKQVDPAQAMLTSRLLWLCLLVSQLIYAGMILAGAGPVREAPIDLPVFPLALGAVAVATGIGSQLFWRRATGAGRAAHRPPPDAATALRFYVVAWVLDQSTATYGLVLGFLAFSPEVWAPFSAAAFGLTLYHRPLSPAGTRSPGA